MILCTFFNTKPWFDACLKFLEVLQLFQFSFFQRKRVNHCESYVKFQDIEHDL